MQTTASVKPASTFNKLLNLLAAHQQKLKWTVYALLILNFGYYVFDDLRNADTTLNNNASFFDITSTFATTLDELGWFTILLLLEIETYWMEDDATGFFYWLMQAVRAGCYVVICHTLYAFSGALIDFGDATLMSGVGNVCELVGQDLSFLRNLLYDPITLSNCASLSAGGELYAIIGEPTVTDASGYLEAVRHAWVDVIEVSGWLIISLSLTVIMFAQDRKIIEGPWIKGANLLIYITYAALTSMAIYWAVYGFYIYTWDILLWMGGFAAIDANLVEWRDELKDESNVSDAEVVQFN